MSAAAGARFAILLVPLFAVLLAAGCRDLVEEQPPLAIVALDSQQAEALVADNVGIGLTARDARGLVIPGIAQSWRVADDGRSIVFRLRAADYSTGKPVLATDVVASVRAAIRTPPEAVADLVAGISAVSSPLPDVVEILLTTPQPELLELLAHPAFAIRPAGRGAVRAGPYVRAAPDPDSQELPEGTLLEQQEHFYDPHEGPERVVIATAGPDEAIRRFRNLEADIVTGGALDGLGLARTLGAADALKMETSRAAMLLLVNYQKPPMADRRVRRALAMAIDRDRLGPLLFGSASALPVNGLAPAGLRRALMGAEPDWASLPLSGRRADALRLLEESGFGPDNPLVIAVATTDRAGDERLMQAVADDLAQIGVRLTLERRTAQAHAAAVARGDFALALTTRASPVDSVLPFLAPMRCGRNRLGVCIPEADRLVDESWRAASPVDRAVALASAERLWAEDAAVIGLVQPLAWSLVSKRVDGWAASEAGVRPFRFLSFLPYRKLLP